MKRQVSARTDCIIFPPDSFRFTSSFCLPVLFSLPPHQRGVRAPFLIVEDTDGFPMVSFSTTNTCRDKICLPPFLIGGLFSYVALFPLRLYVHPAL